MESKESEWQREGGCNPFGPLHPPPPPTAGDAADVVDYLWGGEQLLLGGRGAPGLGGLGGSGALTLVASGSGGRLSQVRRRPPGGGCARGAPGWCVADQSMGAPPQVQARTT